MSEDDEKTIIAERTEIAKAPPASAPLLVQHSGQDAGKRFNLEQAISTLGRSVDADLVITDPSVSRVHAKISQEGSKVVLEDLNSSNGTWVNNRKITDSHMLQDSDTVKIGAVRLKFYASGNIEGMIHDKIYRMATMDGLTGLFNKKYLEDALEWQFRTSQASGRSLCVICMDLDHFKKVNDTYGHQAGDKVLQECSQMIKQVVRQNDIVGRIGGEEFALILPDTPLGVAKDLAERILTSMEAHPMDITGTTEMHKQTVSAGVAELTPHTGSALQLLEEADQKLYVSKNSGRNRVSF
ncbi:MAG: diguanylate cyclase [Oligoflexales bacterium]